MSATPKDQELKKYKEIIIAGLDYYITYYQNILTQFKDQEDTSMIDMFIEHHTSLKFSVEAVYVKKRLGILKRWFRDISEVAIASHDLNYQLYIQKTTGHKVEIFQKLFDRINKIIQSGKINTENQYRNVVTMIDFLEGLNPRDVPKIEELDKLIFDYNENKKAKPKRKS